MNAANIFKDIEGTEFPSGRRTRVMLGENGAINGEYFCQGYVVVHVGGSISMHDHETVESYTILKGQCDMTVDGETKPLKEGDFVYMKPWQSHGLVNTGDEELHMMFVYAPKMIADHWAKEMSGEIK